MKNEIVVFDTTLRDGEQAAGSRLGPGEKLEIAQQLVRLGVDVIEAGFPCSSPKDFEAVQLVAREIRGATVCGLSRAVIADIDTCAKALAGAERARIHTGLGVSDIHILGKFRDEKYGATLGEKKVNAIRMAERAVRHARQFVDDVEFYAEDAGRADRDYLMEILEAVVAAGATTLNIPDTTGYSIPEQWGALIADIHARVPNVDRAVISVHCHDDLGMAVANTLAGVKNGARQVEGTINGIGERAGNAALEEVIMALKTRADFFGIGTRINSREFARTSRLVADSLGLNVPPNKAVVGANAFAHSSGIHVDGVLKDRCTYEIMTPEDVGMRETRIVLTARTGRHGLRHRLTAIGYTVSEAQLEQIHQRFKLVADKKREVLDEDLIAIVHDEIHAIPSRFRLQYLRAVSETGAVPKATVRLLAGEEPRERTAEGDGPVDAAYKALAAASGMDVTLADYRIKAATGGTEAMGEVTVQLRSGETSVLGRGASTDVIEASAKAYVDGLNKLVALTASDKS